MRRQNDFASLSAYRETRDKLVTIAKAQGEFQCDVLKSIVNQAYKKICRTSVNKSEKDSSFQKDTHD